MGRRIYCGNVFPNLKVRDIFGGGGSFRSGVQPPTGADGEVQAPTGTGIRGEAQGRFFRIRNCGGYLAGVERSGRSLSRSGVEPPTGTIHPRKSRGIEDGKWVEGFIAGYAFPNLKVRDIFGGGGSFRSGV